MYKLFVDKNEDFQFEISVKNASLKGSITRLIIESENGTNLVFNGSIEDGKCNIPIKHLRGLINENTSGKMYLEVVVEDKFFRPWQSDFTVEEHTSVKVKIEEQKEPHIKVVNINQAQNINAPIIEVVNINQSQDIDTPIIELFVLCERFNIKNSNSKKEDLSQILKEYFKIHSEYRQYKSEILDKVIYFLQ